MAKNNPPCPRCGAESLVQETRTPKSKNDQASPTFSRPRTYLCKGIDAHSFVTHEVYKPLPLMVRKNPRPNGENSRTEDFSVEKLALALSRAAPRTHNVEQCLVLATEVARAIHAQCIENKTKTIESKEIGAHVLRVLASRNNMHGFWMRYAIMFFKVEEQTELTFNAAIDFLMERRNESEKNKWKKQ